MTKEVNKLREAVRNIPVIKWQSSGCQRKYVYAVKIKGNEKIFNRIKECGIYTKEDADIIELVTDDQYLSDSSETFYDDFSVNLNRKDEELLLEKYDDDYMVFSQWRYDEPTFNHELDLSVKIGDGIWNLINGTIYDSKHYNAYANESFGELDLEELLESVVEYYYEEGDDIQELFYEKIVEESSVDILDYIKLRFFENEDYQRSVKIESLI